MRITSDKLYIFGFAVSLSLCSISPTIAMPILFGASDMNASSLATMPNSLAASNAWDLAAGGLGTIQLIDFESPYPTGPQTSVLLAPGVTLSANVGTFTISNAPPSFFVNAFNTTSGGSYYAGLKTCLGIGCFNLATYTFSFTDPIVAFGLYVTGRGQHPNRPQEFFFNDPSLISGLLPFTDDVTGYFFGFTDAGVAISSVSLVVGGSSFPNLADSFAFDDVRFVTVPEPGSLSLILIGFVPMAAYLFLRRKSRRNNWNQSKLNA